MATAASAEDDARNGSPHDRCTYHVPTDVATAEGGAADGERAGLAGRGLLHGDDRSRIDVDHATVGIDDFRVAARTRNDRIPPLYLCLACYLLKPVAMTNSHPSGRLDICRGQGGQAG